MFNLKISSAFIRYCLAGVIVLSLQVFAAPPSAAAGNSGGFDFGGSANPPSRQQPGARIAKDRVLVKFAAPPQHAESSAKTNANAPVPAPMDLGIAISGMRLLNPSNSSGGLSKRSGGGRQDNVYVLMLEETGEDAVAKAIETLNANPAVEIAEPVFIRTRRSVPNDPMFTDQYALQKINALKAWEITTGSKRVVVGIIDSGIEGDHPDLVDNLWINPKPNRGGYVDDIHGYDFVSGIGGIPTDDHSHGTHVAGIVGAKGNNGIGITGINWDVSLAWLRVVDDEHHFFYSDALIEAHNYAHNNNIPITNNSYGGGGYSRIEEEAICNYFGLFVAAAGNELRNNDIFSNYPSNYNCANIIAVAATDSGDMLSWFSNHGPTTVHIAAPGSAIMSTVLNGEYEAYSGTSMAAPYVAGAAALVLAANPTYTTAQLREALVTTARQSGTLNGIGILDVYAAMTVDLGAIYTITYDFNDGVREPFTVRTAPGKKPIAAGRPSRDGYMFTGWYTSTSGGERFDFSEVIAGNVSLYARWMSTSDILPDMYAAKFPDANFREEVLRMINALDGGGRTEASILTSDDSSTLASSTILSVEYMGVEDLTGLEYFTGLTRFYCGGNWLTELDVSRAPKLRVLYCQNNLLTELDVSSLSNYLERLNCSYNEITQLDVSVLSKLKELNCAGNKLTALDVSENSALEILVTGRNQLSDLDVSKNTTLTSLHCDYNKLTALDVSKNTALKALDFGMNQLTSIDLSNNLELDTLIFCNNGLTALDLSGLSKLQMLYCNSNKLTALDLSGSPELRRIAVSENALTELNITGLNLRELDVSRNYMSSESAVIGFTDVWDGERFIFSPQKDASSVTVISRVIPHRAIEEDMAKEPDITLLTGLTVGPNPAARSSGAVSFFYGGKPVKSGALTIYDASGNVVNRVAISDHKGVALDYAQAANRRLSGAEAADSRRVIGRWNLTDQNGRPISSGTYLAKGTVTGADGKRERVSVIFGIR